MGFDDLTNKAKDAVNSDKGEEISDQGLDKASDAANNLSGGKFEDQINQGRSGPAGPSANRAPAVHARGGSAPRAVGDQPRGASLCPGGGQLSFSTGA
ncbi:antitoxin [Brevibacterium casei]|uniref:antitoxin n=1 Tax=Brevibacterium casei TaxID=33889 RepID=UPI0039F0E705